MMIRKGKKVETGKFLMSGGLILVTSFIRNNQNNDI